MSVGKFLVAFVCLFLFWIGLTGSLDVQELVAGAIVAVFVAAVSYELLIKGHVKDKFEPKRWGYAIAYFPAYVWAEIKSNLDVIYRIVHPKMPIKPGIVEVSTDLRTDLGLTGLANSITMTPGTLSVEIDEKKPCLYVHWINVQTTDPKETQAAIAKPFEIFLRRIFG